MVLYSTGVAFASVAVCEAPALIEETDCQFNNSYSALSSHIPLNTAETATHTLIQTHTHTHNLMCTNAHSYMRSGVMSGIRPQLYTSEIIIIVTNLQVHSATKQTLLV